MDNDEITLNGVKYVRKDAIKNDDILQLKSIVASILSETQENVNKIIDSYIKNESKVPANHIKKITDDEYKIKIFPSMKKIYDDFIVRENGDILIHGRALPLDMYDVAEIEEDIHNITNEDAKLLSQKLNVAITTIHRFIYNIMVGTFKGYNFNPSDRPQKNKKEYKRGYNSNKFKIQESKKILYKIGGITPTGKLYNNYRSLDLDIHQVLKVKNRVVDKDITIGKAKEIATDIGISYDVLQRVAYNLTKNVFDKYIDEWQARVRQSTIKKMPVLN